MAVSPSLIDIRPQGSFYLSIYAQIAFIAIKNAHIALIQDAQSRYRVDLSLFMGFSGKARIHQFGGGKPLKP